MLKPSSISVSILSADFSCLKDQLEQAEAGGADWLHIDVMDGQFVPNISMGPLMVETCRRISSLPRDVHLMIETPDKFIAEFVAAGADLLYVHVESNPHIHRTLQSIRQLGCSPGVVLNPGTPASSVEPVLHLVDAVLVMSVNPGFSGQAFLPEVLPKITQIRHMISVRKSEILIAVDGGITSKTLPQVAEAGADFFISASAVFSYPDGIAGGIQAMRASIPASLG
jgi:ribulose-phosphate 3-epimerase